MLILVRHGFSRADVMAMHEAEWQSYLQLLTPEANTSPSGRSGSETTRFKSLRKKPVTPNAQS